MPKTFEERARDALGKAGAAIGKTLDRITFKRTPKSDIAPVRNATKISDNGMGPTFDNRGLNLYEPALDEKGNQIMVPVDMVKFARKLNRKSNSLSSQDSMALWKPGASSRIPAANAMENYTGLNFASISALADEVSNIVWELYTIKKDGEHEQVLEHDILDLLDAPNPEQTGPEFKFRIISHLELAGNCYIVMRNKNGEPIKNEDEKPAMLTTLNPGRVVVEIDKSSDVDIITGYTLHKHAVEYHYARWQVIHLKRPNPNSELEGIGTTQCIAEWIDVDNDGMEFNRQFFLHGSYLTATIETEATDEDQIDSMRESFMEQHAGVQNANKVLMLMKGMKLTQNLQPKDMAFDKLLATTAQRIHAGTRVSSTLLGTAEADTNRATAETADYVFAKRLVKPRMAMICQQMNEFLVSRYDERLYLSFTDPTPEDKSFRIQEMQAVAASQQVLTINEVREKYMGLGPVPGGDVLMRAQTMVPIDTPVADPTKPSPDKNEEKDEPKKPKKGLDTHLVFRPKTARFARNREIRKGIASAMAEKIGEVLKEIHASKPWNLDAKQYAIVEKEMEDRAGEFRKQLEIKAKNYLADQCGEVCGNLGTVKKTIDATKLFDTSKSVELVIEFATPILKELAKQESLIQSEAVGGTAYNVMENPEYVDALNHSIDLLANKYTDTSVNDLKETIEGALNDGDSMLQIEEKVRKYYDEAKQSRAPMLARTETFRISNSATKAAWKQVGVKELKWFTSPHDNVCEFCQEMSGKTIGIDDNWFNKGDTFEVDSGATMSIDYDDVGAPPLHPNCGCYIQPVSVNV